MIPTITAKDIVVRWPTPSQRERDAMSCRATATFYREVTCQVSDREVKYSRFEVVPHVEEILRTTLLRKIYPVEIARELNKLADEIVSTLATDYRTAPRAREIEEKFATIINALSPRG